MFNRLLCLGLRVMLIAEDMIEMVLHLGNSLTDPTILYTQYKHCGFLEMIYVYAIILCHLMTKTKGEHEVPGT